MGLHRQAQPPYDWHRTCVMAGEGSLRVTGIRQLVRDLQALGLEVDDLKAAFSSIAAKGARLASAFAPKRTGALAASIRGNRAKSKAVVSAGRGKTSLYAGPINYGWARRGIEPAHFMQKADAQLAPQAIA